MVEGLRVVNDNSVNAPMISRIRAHMLRKGLNPKTLAERAKVGRSFVYDIMNGKSTNPTSSKLSAIAEQLEVSVQYLISGVHEVMSPKQQEWSEVVEISSITVKPSESGIMLVSADDLNKPYYFRSEWIYKNLRARPEHLRAIFVKGDSMKPTLVDGDSLLVNIMMRTPNPAGMFILFDGQGLSLNRLESRVAGRVAVIPDREGEPSYEAAISDIQIVGKVVWMAREM